ncbi:hypothetical protein NDU88_003169 [Pleurodeles waltl]|uniref:Uncharacterized protein n=1 Tax=Pleurodeles waltl TaxID=8319 RepID=A0AAV7VF11_PLEWA|nr:hypothetical protein NDU88_003169 [Pleurodeles waltl]
MLDAASAYVQGAFESRALVAFMQGTFKLYALASSGLWAPPRRRSGTLPPLGGWRVMLSQKKQRAPRP